MSGFETRQFTVTMKDSPWSVNITKYPTGVFRVDLFWADKDQPTHSRLLSSEDSEKFIRFMNATFD